MPLTKDQRDALPSGHFAVPGKRRLPINDDRHTKLAWDMVDRTKGLTEDEKKDARGRIVTRARELGIDTAKWDKSLAHADVTLTLAAMSLALPRDDDHPNRMPFKGVLMRLDQPSDEPPGGAGGRRTIMSREVAAAILPSLLGMPVDFRDDFSGHDAQQKIGTITSADVEGNAVIIEGFFYAADFPQECDFIQAEKEALGFSYEIRAQTQVDGALLKIVGGSFTGAAVLFKDKAAYKSTSLAATAEQELNMTKEEIAALLAEAVKPITTQLGELAKKVEKVEASGGDLAANAEMRSRIGSHTTALRNCAASMEAAGIGLHSTQGHVRVLHHMAASMEAEAAAGKLPHIYRDHDWSLSHNAVDVTKAVADALAAAGVKPVDKDAEALATTIKAAVDAAVKPLTDKIDAQATVITDLKAKGFTETKAPDRKTLSAEGQALLNKTALKPDDKTGKIGVRALDAAIGTAKLSTQDSLALKIALQTSDMLDNAA